MSETRLKLIEAIALKQTISARYNGEHIKLAPHLLFERRGDLFITALNLSKSWRVLLQPNCLMRDSILCRPTPQRRRDPMTL